MAPANALHAATIQTAIAPKAAAERTTAPAKPSTPVAEPSAVIATAPSMHKGGPVEVDGTYKLKKGEHVLTAHEASRARKLAALTTGLKSLAAPKKKEKA